MCVFLRFFFLILFLFPPFIEIDSINKQFHKYKRKILCSSCSNIVVVHTHTQIRIVHVYPAFQLKETGNIWFHISEKWTIAVISAITHALRNFFHQYNVRLWDGLSNVALCLQNFREIIIKFQWGNFEFAPVLWMSPYNQINFAYDHQFSYTSFHESAYHSNDTYRVAWG